MIKQIDGWLTAPQGFIAAGVKAGIKASGKEDVAVIMSTVPAAAGAVFTQNKMCAAPVIISREAAKQPYAQVIVVNSGCANACTGEKGLADAREMASFTAGLLDIDEKGVYVWTGLFSPFNISYLGSSLSVNYENIKAAKEEELFEASETQNEEKKIEKARFKKKQYDDSIRNIKVELIRKKL